MPQCCLYLTRWIAASSRGVTVLPQPSESIERERDLGAVKMALVLVHRERRDSMYLRRLLARSEPFAQHEWRIKLGQGQLITNIGNYAAAVVHHLNLNLINVNLLTVGRMRPDEACNAEHIVRLELKPLPLAPALGFPRPKVEAYESGHADNANKPRVRGLDRAGVDWPKEQASRTPDHETRSEEE